MKEEIRLKAIYGYQEVFIEPLPDDTFLFLGRYSTKNILIKIAHINAIIFHSDEEKHDKKILEEVFFGNAPTIRTLLKYLDDDAGNGSFFASAHLSELIKDVLNNYKEDQVDDIEYGDFAIDLFKTILIYNEKHNHKLDSSNNLKSFKDVFTLSSLQQYYIRSTTPTVYLIKFAFMCKFLNDDLQLRDATISFCKKYDIGSPWNIAKFLISLYKDKDNANFVLDKSAIPSDFLKDWSIGREYTTQKEKITLNFDIIPRPLFEIDNEKYIILDFNFFQYTVDQGFFFKVFDKVVKESTLKLNNLNNFKAYIGLNYFENFLCNTLLRRIFSHRQQVVYSDDKYQDFLIKTSSDNLLVIESKMTDVHARSIEDIDFNAFKDKLEVDFLSKKGVRGKNKGVYQILNQLEQIADKGNQKEVSSIFKIKNIKRLNVYPVLLVSDTNYNSFGTNLYLNEKCSDDLEAMIKEYQTVKPVLILNANTLIKYYYYFKRDKNNFTELIKDYFKEISRQQKRYHSDTSDIYSYLLSSRSFDTYIQERLRNESVVEHFTMFSKDFAKELSELDFS